ncbi:MAG TPA: hypothetical protein VFB01_10280 [Burkholderiales bacterium]|nr:hypothetical protein [Burkholderiales bacterium]
MSDAGTVFSAFSRALCVLVLCAPAAALAYRPFDSTDADVAKAGDLELELGPVGRLREGSSRIRVQPAVVANYGLTRERELVLEGRREILRDGDPDEPRSSIRDNALSLKQVLRRGVLQDAPGPSVATELGLLLPDVHGEKGTGASIAGIVSQRTEAVTAHWNAALEWTRAHEPGAFLGVILEGPHAWALRPVAEAFGEQASGAPRTTSALVGAIWRVREDLSFDIGVRRAHGGGETVRELRIGLTWAFGLRKEP